MFHKINFSTTFRHYLNRFVDMCEEIVKSLTMYLLVEVFWWQDGNQIVGFRYRIKIPTKRCISSLDSFLIQSGNCLQILANCVKLLKHESHVVNDHWWGSFLLCSRPDIRSTTFEQTISKTVGSDCILNKAINFQRRFVEPNHYRHSKLLSYHHYQQYFRPVYLCHSAKQRVGINKIL